MLYECCNGHRCAVIAAIDIAVVIAIAAQPPLWLLLFLIIPGDYNTIISVRLVRQKENNNKNNNKEPKRIKCT